MIDLFCVSGTSPTEVQLIDHPAKTPQDEFFFASFFASFALFDTYLAALYHAWMEGKCGSPTANVRGAS